MLVHLRSDVRTADPYEDWDLDLDLDYGPGLRQVIQQLPSLPMLPPLCG